MSWERLMMHTNKFLRKLMTIFIIFTFLMGAVPAVQVPVEVQAMSSAPVNLQFQILNNQAYISWDALSGAASYKVYVNNVAVHSGTSNTSMYLDTVTWKNDRLYKVQVSAVSATNVEGPRSTHILAYRPTLSSIRQVSMGGYHTLILKSDGTVSAFGAGKTNTGTSRLHGQSMVPAGLNNVIAVAAGGSHSVALKSDGTVVAWGAGTTGEFAHGQSTVPAGLNDVVRIFVGNLQSYAMKSDGSIVGWGLNATVPSGVSNVLDLVGGEQHSLAILANGTVVGWGDNSYGQISIPTGLSNVVQLAAGHHSSLALKSDGTLVAWGAGTTNTGTFPHFGQSIIPSGLNDVTAITGGGQFYLALRSNGTVVGWGSGQTVYSPICTSSCTWGYSHQFGQSAVPAGLSNVSGIDAGLYNSIVFKKDGTAVAWGAGWVDYNTWPQYGQSIVPAAFAVAETVPPSVPLNLVSTDVRSNRFQVSWEASTDNIAVDGYEVFLNGSLVATTSTRSYTFQNLTQLTNYTVEVRAFDAANNKSAKSTPLVVTTGDGTPPSIPTGLVASEITATSFKLSWSPSTDNVSVSGYKVFLNGTYAGQTSATSLTISGVAKKSTYSLTVVAYDNLNNTSNESQPLLVTTPDVPPPDTTAPSAPSNLAASGVSTTSLSLSWMTATDNIAVTGYDVYRGSTLLTTVTGGTLTYDVTGLTAGTTYTFTVRAKDAAGNVSVASNELTVKTRVAPTGVTLTSTSVAENMPINTTVGTIGGVDGDAGETFVFTLVTGTGSTDNSSFNINGNSLRTSSMFDAETKSSYSIRVRVTDSIGLTFEQVFTITVTNVNEAPTISNVPDAAVDEDSFSSALSFTIADVDTAVGSLTVSGSSSNTTLVPSANIAFGGSGANRTVTITPVANQSGTATITVTVSDGALTASDTFVVTVTAVNDAPTISDIANQSINEDAATTALSFTVGDVDTAAGSLTVNGSSSNTTLVPNANIVFGGSGANRTVTITPVANQNGSATITVTVSDGSLTANDTFVVTVTAVNDAPTISDVANQSTNEDATTSAIAITVGDVETAAASLTMSGSSSNTTLVPNANIVFGGLGTSRTVTITPAANQNGMATITVTVSDGSLTANDTFVVTVTAVNDAPTISDIVNQSSNEDAMTGAIAFNVDDIDSNVNGLTINATSSNTTLVPNSNIVFAGSGASRTVSITPVANQNGLTTITVTVSDGSLTATDTFVLTVNAVNDAPTISDISDLSVNKNNSTGAISFTVGDIDTSSLALTVSATSSNTTLVPNNNIILGGSGTNRTLTITPIAGKFGIATITVTVNDGSLTATNTFVLTVIDTNVAPSDIILSGATVSENAGANQAIGTLTATDANAGDTFTFTLVSGAVDNQFFNISGMTLRANDSFNFEVKSSYSVTVRVSDNDGASYDETLTVSVINVNEVATDINLSSSIIAENAAINATVGTLSNDDPDGGQTFVYSLVSGVGDSDNSEFNISGTALRASVSFNFESKSSYSVRVRVSDGTLSFEESLSIAVSDVNEAPNDITLSADVLDENAGANAQVGTLSATDQDTGNVLTFSLIAGAGATDNNLFLIEGNTLRAVRSLNFEEQSSYSIRVQVSDGSAMYSEVFTVTVTDVNEAPSALGLSSNMMNENNELNAEVGVLSAEDPDAGSALVYSLELGAGADDNTSFEISGTSLKAKISFDFETKSSYTVRVRVTDGTLHHEEVFVIEIGDTNDAPTALELSNNIIDENVWVGYTIGELSAIDIDAGDTFTYSLVAGEGDSDNANFTTNGNQLRAAIVFSYATKDVHEIRLRVTDSGGASFEQAFTIYVRQSNAVLDVTNKIVTIFFKDNIFAGVNSPVALKNLITIARNTNLGVPTFEPLMAEDTVVIRGNRLVLTFKNQITGYFNRIKIGSGALKDRLGYLSSEQITTPLVVDDIAPSLIKVTMDKKKRELTLHFSEVVTMATSGVNAKEIADRFRENVQMARGGGAYAALGARDKLTVNGRTVEIKLISPLSSDNNRIKIAENSLRDMLGNLAGEIETPEIDLDANGPILSKVTLAPDNKTIIIQMNEEALGTTNGSRVVKKATLRAAIWLSTNANVASPTYTALTSVDDVELVKGVLTIKLATALTGAHNRIKLGAGIMRDIFGNTNGELTTSVFAADKVGPTFVSTDLPLKKANRMLVIAMNETISNGFTSGKSTENRAALKNAMTIKTDDGEFVALDDKDSIKISKNQLMITFATALVKDKSYQVKLSAGALQDLTGNKIEEMITETFAVDTSGPKLR